MTWIDKNEAMPAEGQEVEVLGDDGIVRHAEGCHIGDQEGFLVNATADFVNGDMHYEVTHWRVPNAQGNPPASTGNDKEAKHDN